MDFAVELHVILYSREQLLNVQVIFVSHQIHTLNYILR